MDAHLRELLDLVIRWVHVIAGIMWIGNSLLFNWLDRNLVKLADKDARHEGEIWLLHSGGFYQVEKKQLPPGQMPAVLHWFKWQNFTTWASGISLLVVVYYMGGLLLEPESPLSVGVAITIGVVLMPVAWLVYDGLWRLVRGRAEAAGAVISFALIVGSAWGLARVFSARAAFIHVGAVLGTLMVANVWERIIPAQRAMVEAMRTGRPPDLELGVRAKERSRHNTFMVVPLVLIMLSSHFPTITFGHRHAWAMLGGLTLFGWAVAWLYRKH